MYRHFERQREIFFIRGQAVDDRKHKRETRSPSALRASPFLYSVRSAALLSLPHWGRGTASAVDRVLSLAVICAKTFFHLHHLSFMPPVPPTSALRAPPSKGRRDRYTRNAPHSRPFLWKGLPGVARRGWLPRMLKMRFPVSLSPLLSGIAPYIFAAKPPPSFLIPHSSKAFIHNQRTPHGLIC